MAVSHKQHESVDRLVLEPVEVASRVSVAEVARPAAQVPVEILHDILDRQQQPLPRRQLTDAITGVLHRRTGGPAGEEGDVLDARAAGAHPAVMEAEEN